MSGDFYSNEAALKVQEKVLVDEDLSDSVKLMFCRLNCKDSFRLGWIIYETAWTDDNWASISELGEKGYVYIKEDSGVGLIPLEMKPN